MQLTKELITQRETQLVEAIKTSDLEQLDQLLHDDLLFIAPNGAVITKKADLDAHRAGGMVVDRLTLTVEEINLIHDTAIAVVVYDTSGTMMGNPIEGKFRYIRTWKTFDQDVKIISGSCTPL